MSLPESEPVSVKLAHLSDTHLRDTQYQLRLRGNDFTQAVIRCIRKARALGVDLLVHAGDLLDTLRPSARTVMDLTEIHKELIKNDMTMLVVSGNHDFTNPPWSDIVAEDCKQLEGCRGLSCFDNKEYVLHKDGCKLTLRGLPFMSRTNLVENLRTLKSDVLVWHGMVRDFVQYPLADNAEIVAISDFPEDRFALVALGDIHVPAILTRDDNTVFCYPGSTELCAKGEPLEKGFYVHEFNLYPDKPAQLAESRFVPIETRMVLTLQITSEEDLADAISTIRRNIDAMPLVMVSHSADLPDTLRRLTAAIDTSRCILRVSSSGTHSASGFLGVLDEPDAVRMHLADFLPKFITGNTQLYDLGQAMIDPARDGRDALDRFVEKALEINL